MDRWNRQRCTPLAKRTPRLCRGIRNLGPPICVPSSMAVPYVCQMEYLRLDISDYCYLSWNFKVHWLDFATSCDGLYLTSIFLVEDPSFAKKRRDRPPSQKQVTTVNEGLSNGPCVIVGDQRTHISCIIIII